MKTRHILSAVLITGLLTGAAGAAEPVISGKTYKHTSGPKVMHSAKPAARAQSHRGAWQGWQGKAPMHMGKVEKGMEVKVPTPAGRSVPHAP